MAAARTLTRDNLHVYLTLASTGGVWECPIDFESEALAEGWVYAAGPPGVQVGSPPLTKAQADSLYDPIGTDLPALDSQTAALAGTAGSQLQTAIGAQISTRGGTTMGPAIVGTGDSKMATNVDSTNNVMADSWLTHLWVASGGDLNMPVNAGHGGYTSTQLAALFDAEVIAKAPSVVLEDMGTNDTDATGVTTVNNLTTLLAKCRAIGSTLVVTTLTPVGTATLNSATPSIPAPASIISATGGTVAPTTGTVGPLYRVTAVNGLGETQAGNAVTAQPMSGATNSVFLEAPFVAGATGYNFYKSLDSGTTWGKIGGTAASGATWLPSRTFTDTGIAPGAVPPGADTTGVALTAANRSKVIGINAAKRKFAADNGLICLDFYSQAVDPTTGMWKTGFSRDGTHPTPATSRLLGAYAWSQLQPYFRRAAPWGSLDPSDQNNLFPGSGTSIPNANGVNSNGMLQSGSATAPTGWSPSHSAPTTGASSARGTRTGHRGAAYSLTRTGLGSYGLSVGGGPWFTTVPGHKYALRFKAELAGGEAEGGNISVGGKWHNQTSGPGYLTQVFVAADIGPTVVTAVGIAPPGATQFEVFCNLLGKGTAAISEIFVYDLTVMGLA